MELCNIILFTIAGFTLSYGKPRNGYDVMELHARIWKGLFWRPLNSWYVQIQTHRIHPTLEMLRWSFFFTKSTMNSWIFMIIFIWRNSRFSEKTSSTYKAQSAYFCEMLPVPRAFKSCAKFISPDKSHYKIWISANPIFWSIDCGLIDIGPWSKYM